MMPYPCGLAVEKLAIRFICLKCGVRPQVKGIKYSDSYPDVKVLGTSAATAARKRPGSGAALQEKDREHRHPGNQERDDNSAEDPLVVGGNTNGAGLNGSGG